MLRLKDKVAIITGGGTGIGEATALLFAEEGAKLVLMGRRKQPLDKVATQIKQKGRDALSVSGDVSRANDCQRVITSTMKNWGKIDILINNAAVYWETFPHNTPENEWDKILDINLKGTYLITKSVIPTMLSQKKGSIVNISSILGMIAMQGCFAYNTSKGGIIAFTRSVAIDYAKEGIRCNCICPGGVETPMLAKELKTRKGRKALNEMHPIGRMGQPIDVAYAILYFASDESSWVTGSVLAVDGGYTAQ